MLGVMILHELSLVRMFDLMFMSMSDVVVGCTDLESPNEVAFDLITSMQVITSHILGSFISLEPN